MSQSDFEVHSVYTHFFIGPLCGTTRMSWYQKKHSPTHTHLDHQICFINFLHLLRSIASICVLDSPFPQPLSRSSLVFLLVCDPPLNTPYISSPNHHLVAAHAHTTKAYSLTDNLRPFILLVVQGHIALQRCGPNVL